MRHYCASAMLERGLSSKRVASWLGHTGTAMVESTYGHLLDRSPNRLSEADVFVDALGLHPER
jgi:integrase